MLAISALVAASLIATPVFAIPTIEAKGAKFFTSDGEQYFLKGIAYQLTPNDPLVNTEQCQLDAALMKKLGANSIRVYHVHPNNDHKGCMSAFSDANIHLWVDLDTFDTQINQVNPTWTDRQFHRFAAVMDEFQQFDNTAGFFVGNEVLTTPQGSVAAPYVKAAARDMKAYRDSKNYRKIPVGYSAADIASLRPMLQNYLACGDNSSQSVDFYSLNAYEWCGQSSYKTSGYSELNANVSSYNIPIFFSETGCITAPPRTFTDQHAIFGPKMTPHWSGAIIYEWIQEANNYGLVSYGPLSSGAAASSVGPAVLDGFTRLGTPTPISPDFPNLSSQWATLTPSSTSLKDYNTATLTPPPCPTYTSGAWLVNGDVKLPSLNEKYNSVVQSSITAGTTTKGGANSVPTAKGKVHSKTQPGVAGRADGMAAQGLGLVGMLAGLLWV